MKENTPNKTWNVRQLASRAAGLWVATAALGGVAWAQSGSDSSVTVRVNREPVTFTGQPPIEQNGRLLVPLRGVLEKMGAYVQYDSNSQTVTAFQGESKISLPIGQRTATVNGRDVTLDVPAQVVNGSTMVPLRFVAESLGAQVNYNVAANTVSIFAPNTGSLSVASNGGLGTSASNERRPFPRRIPGTEASGNATFIGTVQAVYSDVSPSRLVVRIASDGGIPGMDPGSDHTVLIRQDTALTVDRPNGNEVTIPIGRIRVGDRVAVLRDSDGTIEAVNVLARGDNRQPANNGSNAAVFKGRFRRWIGLDDRLARLEMQDGRSIDVRRGILVMNKGQQIGLDDLRPGDAVTVSIDPDNGLGNRVLVTFRE